MSEKRKQYFVMHDMFHRRLPLWFVNAKGRKWIEIVEFNMCYYFETDKGEKDVHTFQDVSLHSTIIDRDPDREGFMCMSNLGLYPRRVKWELFTNKEVIEIHFETLDKEFYLAEPDEFNKDYHFQVRFLLIAEVNQK